MTEKTVSEEDFTRLYNQAGLCFERFNFFFDTLDHTLNDDEFNQIAELGFALTRDAYAQVDKVWEEIKQARAQQEEAPERDSSTSEDSEA